MGGGILRAIAAFVPPTTAELILQTLYLVTDVFIMLGLMAFYARWHQATKVLGFAGFLMAVVGILLIRSGQNFPLVPMYLIGASMTAIGLIFFGWQAWLSKSLPGWVVGLWVISLLSGSVAYASPWPEILVPIVGLLFALGFFGAGLRLWAAASAS